MYNKLIISATGLDRKGIVSDISRIISDFKGNIETSRMVRLGEQFSLLILIVIKTEKIDSLSKALNEIDKLNFSIFSTKSTKNNYNKSFQIFINGADNEGIVYSFTKYFKNEPINIEEVNTSIENAPMSASPLFMMHLIVSSDKDLIKNDTFLDGLNNLADKLGVGIEIDKY